MSEDTFEDALGVWEIRREAGRTTMVLIRPAAPKAPAKKKGAKKKGAKKSASKED